MPQLEFFSDSAATFSKCGQFRYRLFRMWDMSKPTLLVVMLNPSVAGAARNDPTISTLISFAKRWEYGSIMVLNLFAFVSPYPKVCFAQPDPVGPDNDHWIGVTIRQLSPNPTVLCAWGRKGTVMNRGEDMLRMLRSAGAKPISLGLTKNGQPRHPLRVRHDTPPIEL